MIIILEGDKLTKEEIYKTYISPKIREIYNLCNEYNIPFLVAVSIGEDGVAEENIVTSCIDKSMPIGPHLLLAAGMLIPGVFKECPELIFSIPVVIEHLLSDTATSKDEMEAALEQLLGR